MMPSMYTLPGYFRVTVLSFWLPTILFVGVVFLVIRRKPYLRGSWVERGAWLTLGVSIALQVAGWAFDQLWMHSLSQDLGLIGSIACGIWAAYLTFVHEWPQRR